MGEIQTEIKKLRDIAGVIRSKNAGPYQLTYDIIFNDESLFEKTVKGGSFNSKEIARVFGISEEKILGIYPYPPAKAIKITILRDYTAGSLKDTDVYGAQQHAPLLDMEVKC